MTASRAVTAHHAILASDFDETLAHEGVVEPETVAALTRFRESGGTIILVSGRQVEDLEAVFAELALCKLVVAENGAVLFAPESKTLRPLAPPPPPTFVAALRERITCPVDAGHVIIATMARCDHAVLETIRETGEELDTVYNRESLMILPAGVNKGSGLRAALDELGAEPEQVVGIGDAENDHSLLAAVGLPVAVANAVPSLKTRASFVTTGAAGAGVREMIGRLLQNPSRAAPAG